MILCIYVFLAVYVFCAYMWHVKDSTPWIPTLALSILPSAIAGGVMAIPVLGIGELFVDHTERTFRMDESSEGWITYGTAGDYGEDAIFYYQSQPNGQLKDYYVMEEDAEVVTTDGRPVLVRQCKDYSTVPEFFHMPFGDEIECSGADSTFYIPEEN